MSSTGKIVLVYRKNERFTSCYKMLKVPCPHRICRASVNNVYTVNSYYLTVGDWLR